MQNTTKVENEHGRIGVKVRKERRGIKRITKEIMLKLRPMNII